MTDAETITYLKGAIFRRDRKIASLEREIKKLWVLVNGAERGQLEADLRVAALLSERNAYNVD